MINNETTRYIVERTHEWYAPGLSWSGQLPRVESCQDTRAKYFTKAADVAI